MSTARKKSGQPRKASGWLSGGLIVATVAAGIAATILVTSSKPATPVDPSAAAPATNNSTRAQAVVPSRLVGRWQRPDGGYVIEIRNVATNGKLDAGYFNPRPINVARAEWQNAT